MRSKVVALKKPRDANDILVQDGVDALRSFLDTARTNGAGKGLEVGDFPPPYDVTKEEEVEDPRDDKGNEPVETKGRKQVDILIDIATGEGVELYRTLDDTAFADVVLDGHRETHALRSPGFRKWLRHRYYCETGGAPNNEAMTTAMGVIEAKAQFEGEKREVYLRVAHCNGAIYIDLGDAKWRAIEIDARGWRIVDRPPVRFRRGKGMLPLVVPQKGGSIEDLKKVMPVEGDTFHLVVGFILTAMRGLKPFPILALAGEQGSGKSNMAIMIKRLIDPNTVSLRSTPKDTRDLAIAANVSHVLVFDNLSGIPAEMADAMCRLATGGGFATRALYTDGEEVQFSDTRPQILTSIDDVATRSDLADRAVLVTLEPIAESKRKTEAALWAAFDKETPKLLGALLSMIAHGLKHLPNTKIDRFPRMADHALWVQACEGGAGWATGMHLDAYARNRNEAVDIVLDADPVAAALRQHMQGRHEIIITSAELLTALGGHVQDHVKRDRTWPQHGRGLSGRLKRLAPALRKIGIAISRPPREPGTRRRLLVIESKDVSE